MTCIALRLASTLANHSSLLKPIISILYKYFNGDIILHLQFNFSSIENWLKNSLNGDDAFACTSRVIKMPLQISLRLSLFAL